MTNYDKQKRSDLESILNNQDKYPPLFSRYQVLLENKFSSKINLNSMENFRKDSYDFSSSIGNFKKRFEKRSDSMKFVSIGKEFDSK